MTHPADCLTVTSCARKNYANSYACRDLPILTGVVAAYQLGLVSATRAAQYSATVVAGLQVDFFWQTVRTWFDEVLVHHITAGGKDTVAWHAAQGHILLVCTASPQFSVLPVTEYLNIPHYICSEWLSTRGRLTGEIRLPIAHGEGKVLYVNKWASQFDVDLNSSYFYTDHISDKPLLERVGHPVAIAPDAELTKLSLERGWRIDKW